MEDNSPVIEDVTGGVLLDNTHDPANKLNEGRQIGEDSEDYSNCEERMVEALTEPAGLHDHVQLVAFEALHDTLIGRAVLTGMHIVHAAATSFVGFNDLTTVLAIEGRGDNLQAVVASGLAELVQLPDRSVNNGVQRLSRGHDAAAEISVLLAEAAHFVKADLNLMSVFVADIVQDAQVEDKSLQALDVAIPEWLGTPGRNKGCSRP